MSALAGVECGTLPGCRAIFRPTRAFKVSAKADLAAIYKTLTHVKFYVYRQLQLNALKEDLKDLFEFNSTQGVNPPRTTLNICDRAIMYTWMCGTHGLPAH